MRRAIRGLGAAQGNRAEGLERGCWRMIRAALHLEKRAGHADGHEFLILQGSQADRGG